MFRTVEVSGLSIAGLIVLLAGVATAIRGLRLARERRRLRVEERLRPALVAIAAGETGRTGASAPFSRRERDLVGRLAGTLLVKVRGEGRERLASFLLESGVTETFANDARRRSAAARQRAVVALGLLGAPSAPPLLRERLTDRDAQVRSAAAAALGRIADPDSITALLDSAGRVPFGTVARSLVGIGAAGVPTLRRSMFDARPAVRALSIRVIALLGATSCAAELAAVLLDDPVAEVRICAAQGLGRLEAHRTCGALVASLETDEVSGVRAASAAALARVGSGDAVDPLRAALGDPDLAVSQNAAQALACLGSEGTGMLVAASTDDGRVGAVAREALAFAEAGWLRGDWASDIVGIPHLAA